MYIERLLIMVPPLVHPHLSFQWSSYFPSPVEMTIMIGSLSLAILLYCLAVKFVPVISVWEEKVGRKKHESLSS
jgi:Ni/Fe-hydrogenase subunit HybB-like protein